jgi:hypothetical protein
MALGEWLGRHPDSAEKKRTDGVGEGMEPDPRGRVGMTVKRKHGLQCSQPPLGCLTK